MQVNRSISRVGCAAGLFTTAALVLAGGCDRTSAPPEAEALPPAKTAEEVGRFGAPFDRDWDRPRPIELELLLDDAHLEAAAAPRTPRADRPFQLIAWVDRDALYTPVQLFYRVAPITSSGGALPNVRAQFDDADTPWQPMLRVHLGRKDYEHRVDVPLGPTDNPEGRWGIVQVFARPVTLPGGTYRVEVRITYPPDLGLEDERAGWTVTVE